MHKSYFFSFVYFYFEKAKKDAETGYTINEDNAIYETYPYKVRW